MEFSGVCMALNMNSVGIPEGFRARPGFRENLGFGVVSGDLGPQKNFANSQFYSVSARALTRNSARTPKIIPVTFFR